jgi:hypothetical protein
MTGEGAGGLYLLSYTSIYYAEDVAGGENARS